MAQQDTLFELPKKQPTETKLFGKPRLRCPERMQVEVQIASLDELISNNHRDRIAWDFVQQLDLSKTHEGIFSVEGSAGRPAIDPRILMTLWLFATIEGFGSARQIARFTEENIVYKWICGGVSVNYHTLADFRIKHEELFDDLLTQSVAVMMTEGLVTLNTIAQDGCRVRASAGQGSFKRKHPFKS